MELGTFLNNNEIRLSPEVFISCQEAINRMEKSVDPLHNEQHIFRLLDNLNDFLRGEKNLEKRIINFEVLLLALCWHDVWKSRRLPKNFSRLIIDQWWDGIGSMLIFVRDIKKINVGEEIIRPTRYAIRKHARFQLLRPQTTEAKILRDIDNLDSWSLLRIEPLSLQQPNSKILRLGEFYFNHFMLKEKQSRYYFEWSRQEAKKRKKLFSAETNKLIQNYKKILFS